MMDAWSKRLNIKIVCAYCGTQKKNAFVQCASCGALDTKVLDGKPLDPRQVQPVANGHAPSQ